MASECLVRETEPSRLAATTAAAPERTRASTRLAPKRKCKCRLLRERPRQVQVYLPSLGYFQGAICAVQWSSRIVDRRCVHAARGGLPVRSGQEVPREASTNAHQDWELPTDQPQAAGQSLPAQKASAIDDKTGHIRYGTDHWFDSKAIKAQTTTLVVFVSYWTDIRKKTTAYFHDRLNSRSPTPLSFESSLFTAPIWAFLFIWSHFRAVY